MRSELLPSAIVSTVSLLIVEAVIDPEATYVRRGEESESHVEHMSPTTNGWISR